MKPTKKRKALSALMVLTMLVGLLPVGSVSVYAAEPAADDGNTATVATTAENTAVPTADITGTTVGGFIVNGGTLDIDYSYSEYWGDGFLTILKNTPLTISGGAEDDEISVAEGVNAKLTFDGVNIENYNSPIDVPAGASLTLTLAAGSENTLTFGSSNGVSHNAGIHVPEGASLTINCETHESSCPGDDGCGSLTLIQNNNQYVYGAGIGGNEKEAAGTITINGGVVRCDYYGAGAGIGGGDEASGGTVAIYGGGVAINTRSGTRGSGIGAGDEYTGEDGGSLTLSGGVLEETTTSTAGSFTMTGGQLLNSSIQNEETAVSAGTLDHSTLSSITSWNDTAITQVANSDLSFINEATINQGGEGNTYRGTWRVEEPVTFSGATTFEGTATVNADVTLSGTTTLQNGTMTVDNGVTVTNNGTLTIENTATVNNSGTLINSAEAFIHLRGTIDNECDSPGTLTNLGTFYLYEDGRIFNNNQVVGPNVPRDPVSQPVPAGEVVIDLDEVSGHYIEIGKDSYTIDNDFNDENPGRTFPYDPAKNTIVLTGEWTGSVGANQTAVKLLDNLTSTVILRDAKFNMTDASNDFYYASILTLSDGCETTLLLEGENVITANNTNKHDNRSIAIHTASTSSLTIDGEGSLNFDYSDASFHFGIGNTQGNMGTIIVNGGELSMVANPDLWSSVGYGLFYGENGNLVINDCKINGEMFISPLALGGEYTYMNVIVNGGNIDVENGYRYFNNFTNANMTINGGHVSVPTLNLLTLTVNGGELVADVYCSNNFVINGGVVTIYGTRIGGDSASSYDSQRKPDAITGGSVKMIYSDNTKELANVGSYYLTELTGQSGVTSVTVDGVNQNIAANHPDGDSLYLYLKHDYNTTSHTIVTLCGTTQTTYIATWDETNKNFKVEESGGGTPVTPSKDKLTMSIKGADESGALEKVVGDNEPLAITVDLSKVGRAQQPPSNSLINRPATPNNDLGYDWNTVILYCDDERIDSQLLRSGQQTAVFYVQTETLGVGEHRFQATYAVQGETTELALSNEILVNIVQASLEGADVTPPTLSGTYGDKISALTIDGGSVTLGSAAVEGEWTITEDDEDSVLDVGTEKEISLTFTLNNKNLASITQKVTPSISKKTLTASISGTPSKTYDGTTAYNEELMIALTGVVSGDTVTATASKGTFAQADAGSSTLTVSAADVTLSGTDAGNYTLSEEDLTKTGSISKATVEPTAGTLSVKNGYAASYTFELEKLLPTLDGEKSFGTVNYSLGENAVSLEEGYYTSGAEIKDGELTLPINQVASTTAENIGTISVTITSTNYEDMTATIKVSSVNRETQDPPADNKGYRIDFTIEKITADSGCELSTSSTADEGSDTLNNITPGSTVYVRKAGNATYQPSAWTAINLPARPEVPAAPAIEKSRDSIIVSEVSGQEYKLREDGAWQDSSAFTGLNAGTDYTISIRTAATDDDFASATVSVSVTTLNADGSSTVADGETAILPDGTTVKNDDGKIIITDENDNITAIQPAPATGVDIDENGNVQAPEGSSVVTGDTTVNIGDKGAGVEPDGDIILPGGGSATIGDSTITAPESGGTVTVDEGGNITLPGGSTVTSGGETVTLPPEGGILTPGGDLTYGVTVTFDSRGGTAVPAQENIPVGETATEPARPSKGDNTFTGWYTDPACTQRWDFSQPVTADMTLYAGWTPYTGSYSYEIVTDVGENGTIDVDRYATEGERVTITVSPDEAYLLDELTVTSGGKDVELTDHGDGTYSFTMPSGDVAITATFAEDPNWSEPEEPATDVSEIFTDIPADHWARAVIQYVYDNGLMTGTSATTFAPEVTTTRGMIVSMLARLEGVTSAEPAGFTDVSADDWYATAVNWAASAGIVNGYEDNTFQPNAAITREQLAAMLMNYAQWKGQDTSARADLSHYSDADSISSWANDVLSWAVAEGLLTGVTDDTIAPQVHATRAQVAAILQRFLSE